MRKILALTVFMLATLVWANAQQPPSSTGQPSSPSAQTPSAGQQTPTPGSAGQSSAQPGSDRGAAEASNAPITEGCLGGTNPNFTLTDKAGTTYKLNFSPDANTSSLTPHVGESVQVLGPVTKGDSGSKPSAIDVSKIGRGTGNCPGASSKQPSPK